MDLFRHCEGALPEAIPVNVKEIASAKVHRLAMT